MLTATGAAGNAGKSGTTSASPISPPAPAGGKHLTSAFVLTAFLLRDAREAWCDEPCGDACCGDDTSHPRPA